MDIKFNHEPIRIEIIKKHKNKKTGQKTFLRALF